jgi:hypothetical protein
VPEEPHFYSTDWMAPDQTIMVMEKSSTFAMEIANRFKIFYEIPFPRMEIPDIFKFFQ